MATRTAPTSPMKQARLAGFLYLMLLPAPFGLIYLPARLIVSGDAAATAAKITAAEALFRLGIVSNLVVPVINILLVLALYRLLRSAGKTSAVLMVLLVVTGASIAMLNELSQLAVLRLLSGTATLDAFTVDQLQALAYLLLNLHGQGLNIAMIFWGLWLLPLGYLVVKSGFIPRLLGVLLIIGGLGYVIQSLAAFLVPGLNLSLIFLTSWGELLLLLWLLIKGVNVERWEQRALEAA